MDKGTLRNVLLVFGTWSVTSLLSWMLSFVLPLGGISFSGSIGFVLLWVWLGLPHILAAIAAAFTLVWVTETRRPFSWLLGLAGLILYTNAMNAWKQLARPWHTARTFADYAGITTAAILPAIFCLLVGIWWKPGPAAKQP